MSGKFWIKEEIEILIKSYPFMQTEKVAMILNRSIMQVYNKAFNLSLKKDENYLLSSESGRMAKGDTRGLPTRFKKGFTPANKGKKWDEFMSKSGQSKSSETTFKIGHLPHNTKSDNHISIRNDGGRKYQYIRVGMRVWVPLHVHIWEKANGKIPLGMIVVFKDRNTMNCKLENLEMITRSENMKRNSFRRYPEEVRKLMQLKGVLNRQIRQKNEHRNYID